MSDRYESAAGWNPRKNDPFKRERTLAAKLFPDLTPTPFEKREADPITAHQKGPLFGSLWRRGEVAVLMGEPGTGKSILAVQIAETLAGTRTSVRNPVCTSPRVSKGDIESQPLHEHFDENYPLRILLLDLEHTDAQLAEHYSVKPLANDDRRIRYEFSDRIDWRTISTDLLVPAAFNGDLVRYFRHWVYDAISWGESDVVVIDSLSRIAKPNEMRDVLLKLKHKAAASGTSILVVAHARAKKRPSPITLADFAGRPEALSAADSVFAIARSYLGPDVRYLKHLSSKSTPIQYDSNSVLLSTLNRMECAAAPLLPEEGWPEALRTAGVVGGPRASSPHVSKGSTQHLTFPNNPYALTAENPRSALRIPQSLVDPFLGFTFHFTAPEPDLIHPPKKEKPVRPKSSKQSLVDAILDGRYGHYLNGTRT